MPQSGQSVASGVPLKLGQYRDETNAMNLYWLSDYHCSAVVHPSHNATKSSVTFPTVHIRTNCNDFRYYYSVI
jgi:hypothetical protein